MQEPVERVITVAAVLLPGFEIADTQPVYICNTALVNLLEREVLRLDYILTEFHKT